MLTNLLLRRSIKRKQAQPHTTAVLPRTLLFGALRPEPVTGATARPHPGHR
jgi:hypothetical protein